MAVEVEHCFGPLPSGRKKNKRILSNNEVQIFYFAPNRQYPTLYFLLNEHPSVSLAFPPVGWQRTVEQDAQMTTVCAWEKTVVMLKHPGHFTSMKNERGAGTRVCSGAARLVPEL